MLFDEYQADPTLKFGDSKEMWIADTLKQENTNKLTPGQTRLLIEKHFAAIVDARSQGFTLKRIWDLLVRKNGLKISYSQFTKLYHALEKTMAERKVEEKASPTEKAKEEVKRDTPKSTDRPVGIPKTSEAGSVPGGEPKSEATGAEDMEKKRKAYKDRMNDLIGNPEENAKANIGRTTSVIGVEGMQYVPKQPSKTTKITKQTEGS